MELSCWGMTMIERAQEELEILETHYPDRFGYLKTELKSFINHHHHLLLLQSRDPPPLWDSAAVQPPPASSSATTQVSSSCKKRKNGNIKNKITRRAAVDEDQSGVNVELLHKAPKVRRKDRVEVVIERAQACIRKIQQFKTSF